MNARNLLEQFYHKEYLVNTEDLIISPTSHSSVRYAAVAYYAEGSGNCLEVGAGEGYIIEKVAKFYRHYIATELSPPRAERMRKKFIHYPNVEIITNDIEEKDLLFEKGYFDLVILSSVLEHLIEPISVINYCYDLLKPNGRILIYTPNLFKWTRRIKVLLGIFPKTGGGDQEVLDGGHLHYFTHNYLKKLLTKYAKFYNFKILRHGKGIKYLWPVLFSECLVEAIK